MPATLQAELPLSAVRVRRPLTDRAGARERLDVDDWQLDRWLDAGKIRGVLDIASRGAEKQELRFLSVAIEEFKRELVMERTNEEFARAIFGLPQPLLRAQRIYSRLNCHPTHFYDLAREKVLRLAKGSEQRTGPGGSAVVEWSELLRFISQRRRA